MGNNNRHHDQFWELIGKVLFAEASESESKQFQRLVLDDQELLTFFVSLQQHLSNMPKLETFSRIDVEADWKEVYARISDPAVSIRHSSKANGFIAVKLRSLLPYAAAAAIILLISGIFFWQTTPPVEEDTAYFTSIEAPLGSQTEVTLPDGSRVMLNSGSSVTYSSRFFHDNRNVSLVGEAYFKVAKQEVPFIVSVYDIQLRVTGTEFNLKAYADDELIEATLVNGSVIIEDASRERQRFQDFELKPNQKATFHRSRGSVSLYEEDEDHEETIQASVPALVQSAQLARIEVRQKRTVEPETSWIDGILIVDAEPLAELVKKLERRYNVTFVFEDEKLKGFRYSGTLKDHTLEQVLRAMKMTSPIDYRLEDKTVTIQENPLTVTKYKNYMN